MRFLAFDCLVIDGEKIMGKTLDKRYGVRMVQTSCRVPWSDNPSSG